MKRLFFSLVALLLVLSWTSGETNNSCRVSGFVSDASTGEAIAGVNLKIQNEPYGAASNLYGYYTIPVLPSERVYTMRVSAIGYRTIEKEFTCSGSALRFDFEMVPEAIVADKVVVQAQRVGGMDDPLVGHTIVELPMIQRSPGLVEPDLFRILQLLPGVLAISDFNSGLYIWGTSPGENLILLDNIRVYNPTHLMGFFSTFVVEAVREVNLVKAGYPSRWGGSLGSVLEVTNKDGNRKETHGMAQLSLLSGQFLVEGPLKRGSYMLGCRRTWIDAATKMMESVGIVDENIPYFFYDIQGRVNQDLSPSDKVTISFYAGDDVFAIEDDESDNQPPDSMMAEDGEDDFEYRWGNVTVSTQWTHIFNQQLFGHIVLAGSRFRAKLSEDAGAFSLKNTIGELSLKGDMTYFLDNEHTLSFGGMLKWRECYNRVVDTLWASPEVNPPDSSERIQFSDSLSDEYGFIWDRFTPASMVALYGEEEWRPNMFWALQGGLRLEYAANGNYFRAGPRLSAQRRLDALTTLRAAVGRYYQYIHLYNPLEEMGFAMLDTWIPVCDELKPGIADHFVLGIDTDHLPVHLAANAYYKKMDNLIKAREEYAIMFESDIREMFYIGDGWAAGFDLSLKGNMGSLSGWVGYALGWTLRQMGDDSDGVNNGEPFYPKYDRRHSFKLYLSYRLNPRLNATASFIYGTGQPVTEPSGFERHQEYGYVYYEPIYEEGVYHNGRLPDYHRLDLGINWTLRKGRWDLELFFQVLNVYNRKNVLMREWDSWDNGKPDDMHMLPLIPTFGFRGEF
ncbi:TonB-dependent receptor [bacterium]|nr:TonB-dependent receptor [bacterium]